jgi:hypothetical protein
MMFDVEVIYSIIKLSVTNTSLLSYITLTFSPVVTLYTTFDCLVHVYLLR